MTHTHPIRVYYEDTDLAGIVYYANYLKFIERGRSEAMRSLGIDQARLKAEAGIVFAVRRVLADYLLPARFDDELLVTTEITAIKGATIEMAQRVLRGQAVLFTAGVRLVCLGPGDRALRIPADIRQMLSAARP
ncbi:MAG: tol-pal system-associated acyl-CoA thioesterase [Paracoccaceae bacterium]